MILDGKKFSYEIEEELKLRVSKIKAKLGFIPCLASIIVGDDAGSITYVYMKKKAAERIGLSSNIYQLPKTAKTQDLIDLIERLNKDKRVAGILLQHPCPKHINELKAFCSISLEKDVDGLNPISFGRSVIGLDSFKCCTPLGIIELLKHFNIELSGKHAVIVGRSNILGKPLAYLLLSQDVTVTVCHSKTKNIEELIKEADIVVGALGKPKFIKAESIKEGAILIDCGYNSGNIGDIDLENAKSKASYYTPVPGGVGPMTIAMLLKQTVEASERMIKTPKKR